MKPISYVNFNELGLKPITDLLTKKYKQPVAEVKATNMPKREDGVQTKSATFALESGQKLEIKIKANGSIFQCKLNGKPIPIKNAEDLQDPQNLAKAIKEVAGYVERNEAAYLKRQGAAAKRTVKTKKATSSTQKQLDALKTSYEGLKQESQALVDELTAVQGDKDTRSGELVALQAELKQELARNVTLTAEYNELKEAV